MTELATYDNAKHQHLVQDFVNIHIDCTLENGMTLADFVPPFTDAKRQIMYSFWQDRLSKTGTDGTDEVVMAFNRDASGVQKLSGYVQLHMPISESGPFRAYVQKLFVSPDFRRLGIASKMMYKLEELALARGRWNISLSTAKPSPARSMYPKLGYIEYGILPNWVIHADTKEPMDEACFYKDLRKS